MWTTSITRRATRLDKKVPRYRVKLPKRGARTRACSIELARKFWDGIVLIMFVCCLFFFLHALFGFGFVDDDLDALNDVTVYPRIAQNWRSVSSNENQKVRAQGVTRVMVDWHGNYDLLPSTTSALMSPATIPQDVSPRPTSPLDRKERRRGPLGEDTPFAFYENLYDPFRLEFEGSDEGNGLYPVAGPSRTAPRAARTRRFGRCLPGEACF